MLPRRRSGSWLSDENFWPSELSLVALPALLGQLAEGDREVARGTLQAVGARQTRDGIDEIEACADRLERAARDLSVALRELAEERRDKDTL